MRYNKINLVVAADNSYLTPAIETIASVIRFDDDIFYKVFLLSDNLDSEKIEKAKNILYSITENLDFSVIMVEKSDFQDCPVRDGDHISLAAYYRIKLPQLLPESIEKVLYLDCDILCTKSIKDFYSTDLNGYSCAVCLDERSCEDEIYQRLSYEKKYGYFNSGMMLINLFWWRINQVQEKTLDYISKNQEILLWHDQDALNFILKGSVLYVPYRYNMLQGYLFSNDYFDEKKNVHFIHYCSSYKPWHVECNNPFKHEYRDFYRKLFGDKCPLKYKNHGIDKIKWIIKYLLNLFRIKRYDDFRTAYLS